MSRSYLFFVLSVSMLLTSYSQNSDYQFPWERQSQPQKGDLDYKQMQQSSKVLQNREFKYATYLNDTNFEELTGSYVGDKGIWVIIFYHDRDAGCVIRKIIWDGFAKKYLSKYNFTLGMLQVQKSPFTAWRFGFRNTKTDKVPEYIVIRDGFYYNITRKIPALWEDKKLAGIIKFEKYLKVNATRVSPPIDVERVLEQMRSEKDEGKTGILKIIGQNKLFIYIGVVVLFVILVILKILLRKKQKQLEAKKVETPDKNQKSEEKETKKDK